MASVDDIDELIATRKLNGLNDNLYKEDSNIEDVEKLKSLLYKGRLTQYGKRMLIKYYENEIQRQKEIIEDYQRMYCRAINENLPKQKIKEILNNKCLIFFEGDTEFPDDYTKINEVKYIEAKDLEELLQESEDQ